MCVCVWIIFSYLVSYFSFPDDTIRIYYVIKTLLACFHIENSFHVFWTGWWTEQQNQSYLQIVADYKTVRETLNNVTEQLNCVTIAVWVEAVRIWLGHGAFETTHYFDYTAVEKVVSHFRFSM